MKKLYSNNSLDVEMLPLGGWKRQISDQQLILAVKQWANRDRSFHLHLWLLGGDTFPFELLSSKT